MAFISLDAAKLAQDKPLDTDLMLQIKDNFDALNGSFTTIATSGIPNGSFEVDSDANGTPDSWTLSTYAGGTVARDTITVAHGQASLKMVHPGGAGNGGGTATSDYVECSELEPVVIQLIHWATATGMKNQVILYWYTATKVACSTASTTVYDSTANPTSETLLILGATPPATARFYKIKLVGGESSVDVAGTAYFDGMKILNDKFKGDNGINNSSLSSTSFVDFSSATKDSDSASQSLVSVPVTCIVRSVTAPVTLRFRQGATFSGEFVATKAQSFTEMMPVGDVYIQYKVTSGTQTITGRFGKI